MTWTDSHTAALEVALRSHLPAHVTRPGDTVHTVALGAYRALLGALPASLRAVAAPVLDALDGLAGRVSVTLATPESPVVVLSPAAVIDHVTEAEVLCHEWVHVEQIAAAGRGQSLVDYLGSGELRAQREAAAHAAGLWMRYVITGDLPTVAPTLAGLYHLDAGDSALASGLISSHLATIRAGLVPPVGVCLAVARWLRTADVPDDVRARGATVPS